MKRLTLSALLAILLSTASASAAAADPLQSLMLSSPTIVVLVPPDSETAALKDDPEFIEFSGDFWHYTKLFTEALKSRPQIQVITSSAREVRFSDKEIAPVVREKLETGHAYIFYRPGAQPITMSGVHIDDELACTAARLYQIQVTGYDCSP